MTIFFGCRKQLKKSSIQSVYLGLTRKRIASNAYNAVGENRNYELTIGRKPHPSEIDPEKKKEEEMKKRTLR